MKCDELKAGVIVPPHDEGMCFDIGPDVIAVTERETEFYLKSDVDAAIAELKAENERLNRELEHVKNGDCINTCDVVEKHVKEELKAKLALCLARAERAYVTTLLWNVYCYQNNCLYFRDFMNEKCNPFRDLPKKTAMEWSNLWESIETKCRAKAEEYK